MPDRVGVPPPAVRRFEPSQERVERQLRLHGPQSRAELAVRSGLSRPTVVSALAELLANGLVVEHTERDPRRRVAATGRAPGVVALDRLAGVAAGVDVGKRHVRVGLSDLAHQIVAERSVDVAADLPAAQAIDLAIGTDAAVIPLYFQLSVWASREGLEYIPRSDETTEVMSLRVRR